MTEDHLSLRRAAVTALPGKRRGGRSRRCDPSLLLGFLRVQHGQSRWSPGHLLPGSSASDCHVRAAGPAGGHPADLTTAGSSCLPRPPDFVLSTPGTLPESRTEIYSRHTTISDPRKRCVTQGALDARHPPSELNRAMRPRTAATLRTVDEALPSGGCADPDRHRRRSPGQALATAGYTAVAPEPVPRSAWSNGLHLDRHLGAVRWSRQGACISWP